MAEDEMRKEAEPKTGKSQESVSDARSQSDSESQDSRTAGSSKPREEVVQLHPSGSHLGTKKMAKKIEKKRERRVGAVTKRRVTRRRRRQPVKRRAHKTRIPSTSTIFDRALSSSRLVDEICKYCGHRCCLRRYQKEKRSFRKTRKADGVKSSKLRIETASVAVQAGSRAASLSPLFIKTNERLASETEVGPGHCEITPEMIHLTLRELTMWREGVPTLAIFKHIASNYPINPDPEEAMYELHEKLHVASLVGLIWALPNDCWRLSTPIDRINKLDQSHVTIFWKVFADTMKPLPLARKPAQYVNRADKQTGLSFKEITSDNGDII